MAATARIVGVKAIEEALVSAFQEWAEKEVNGRYWREKFEDEYKYPGPDTIRKAKPPAGDPRDILDTEALYESGVQSYRYERNSNEAKAMWHWNAKNGSGEEYAWYVHEGKGPYSREPRKWTDEMVDEFQFETSDIKLDLIRIIDTRLNEKKLY